MYKCAILNAQKEKKRLNWFQRIIKSIYCLDYGKLNLSAIFQCYHLFIARSLRLLKKCVIKGEVKKKNCYSCNWSIPSWIYGTEYSHPLVSENIPAPIHCLKPQGCQNQWIPKSFTLNGIIFTWTMPAPLLIFFKISHL